MMTEQEFRTAMSECHSVVLKKHADVALVDWFNNNPESDMSKIPPHVLTHLRNCVMVGIAYGLGNIEMLTEEVTTEAELRGVTLQDMDKYMGINLQINTDDHGND